MTSLLLSSTISNSIARNNEIIRKLCEAGGLLLLLLLLLLLFFIIPIRNVLIWNVSVKCGAVSFDVNFFSFLFFPLGNRVVLFLLERRRRKNIHGCGFLNEHLISIAVYLATRRKRICQILFIRLVLCCWKFLSMI